MVGRLPCPIPEAPLLLRPLHATRRRTIRDLALVLVLTWLAACDGDSTAEPSVDPEPSSRPNLLVVTFDTTRADRIGCYGASDARTPHLDRFAEEGIRVERALAPTPITLPSHTSLFTGLYPPEHGVRENGIFRVEPSLTLLSEMLGDAGYTTAAFVSALVVSRRYGIDQGFATFDEPTTSAVQGGLGRVERSAGEVVDAVAAWLEREPGEPWFVWAHFFDPHAPYAAPSSPATEGLTPYDAEITYADREFGRLIDIVRRRGELDSTLCVVTADHGESLGDHRESTHGLFVYDATVRVPLLLRYPPLGRGVVLDGQVSLVDVFPTVLETLDVELDHTVSGRSFASALTDGLSEWWSTVYLETEMPSHAFGIASLSAIVTDRHKYIRAPRSELYAWRNDPGEERDRIADQPEVAKQLAQQLDDWVGRMDVRALEAQTLSPEERRRLAALGYVFDQATGDSDVDPKDHVEVLGQRSQAAALVAREEFDEATPLLETLVARSTGDATLWGLLGHCHFRQASFEQAIDPLRRSLSLRPDALGSAVDLAKTFEALDQFDDALAAIDHVLDYAPARADMVFRAAQICYDREDFERCLAYLQAGLAANPDDASRREMERLSQVLRNGPLRDG